MKRQGNLVILGISIAIMLSACNSKKGTDQNAEGSDSKSITVKEVIQASSYTYLKGDDNGEEIWLAIPKSEVQTGVTLYYADELIMNDFESKDLGRTFETIYFVQNISDKPITSVVPDNAQMPQGKPHGKIPPENKKEITVEKAEGGVTVGEVYGDRETYKEQTVKVKGEVVKFNQNIMGKNWVHIQDGTENEGNYDLTITTTEVVKVGDVVVFEGIINLNKDFGAGYAYEVIMEEAKLVAE